MDVRITPEPSEEERKAILAALDEDEEDAQAPASWADAALSADYDATARPRSSRGAVRA